MTAFVGKKMLLESHEVNDPALNQDRNDLLSDGNDELAEWIAVLDLDRIVWVNINKEVNHE